MALHRNNTGVEELGGPRDSSTYNRRAAHCFLPHLPHVHSYIHKQRAVPYVDLPTQGEGGRGPKQGRATSHAPSTKHAGAGPRGCPRKSTNIQGMGSTK